MAGIGITQDISCNVRIGVSCIYGFCGCRNGVNAKGILQRRQKRINGASQGDGAGFHYAMIRASNKVRLLTAFDTQLHSRYDREISLPDMGCTGVRR